MAAKPKDIDWDGMESDWRAGIVSLSVLSREYEVSRAAIEKHWDKLGVPRDLNAKIKAKADSKGLKISHIDDMDSSGFVYVIYIDSGVEKIYKIGLAKHFGARFQAHQCSSPFDIFVSCVYFVENMRVEEKCIHAMFDSKRVRGEWFKLERDDLMEIAKRSYIGG